jgi:nicotinamide-nucleotide adenylyltransferase
MVKPTVGLIIGRFQPLHKGHIYLIKEGLKIARTLVIGIGSANIIDFDNPFSAEERERTVKEMLKEEHLDEHIIKIVRLDDNPSDSIWLKQLLEKTGAIDVVIGNNERVKEIFENAGYQVQDVPYFKRDIYEGKKLREQLRKEKKLV